jgi:hypothetical protein
MACLDSEKLSLGARLTGAVSGTSVETFYKNFNLIGTPYSEFPFKDMKQIFHLEGMDNWPEMHRDH